MPLTFTKFFENYTDYHSFVDLLNLCKEVSDYIYNEDITNSQFFQSFKETDKGYKIIFNDNKNYFIDTKKNTVKDENGVEQLIDRAYEDIENLYNSIKNDFIVNIKQMDEKMKTFDEVISEGLNKRSMDLDYDYDEILNILTERGWGDITSKRFEEFERSKYFNEPFTNNEYAEQMHSWLNDDGDEPFEFKFESINEAFQDELGGKLSEKYLSLKKGILDLLDRTLKSDVTKLQGFMDTYIDPDSEEILEGFVEDADIFDFYLKYQSDVDQILLDNNYYDDKPEVESLYDYVIDGTFDAVVYCMEEMKNELFGE